MFFSVIVPVYKVENYLHECVDSILGQNFDDYELILVDDGSPDGSGAICDEYAATHSRVHVIHKENGGLSDARNVGAEKASGEYIIYLDGDDFITDRNFLSELFSEAQKSNSDVIMYKFRKYFDDEKLLEDCQFFFSETHGELSELLFRMVKEDAYYEMAWSKAVRRVKFVPFEKGLFGEDMEWFFHTLTGIQSVSAIDKSYIAYRQREGSITSTLRLKNLLDFLCIIEKWVNYIERSDHLFALKEMFYGALAKYYSNLLVVYSRVGDKEKKDYKGRIVELDRLFNHAYSKRPIIMAKLYRVFGFEMTVFLLKILDMIKKVK